jgi:hypothetical protein
MCHETVHCEEHRRGHAKHCELCCDDWPCDAIRLADALEAATHEKHCTCELAAKVAECFLATDRQHDYVIDGCVRAIRATCKRECGAASAAKVI